MSRLFRVLILAAMSALLGSFLSMLGQRAQGQNSSQTVTALIGVTDQDGPLVSVQGPSWLKHEGLTVAKTHMGQMGGAGASAASASGNTVVTPLNQIVQRFLSALRSNPQQAPAILHEQFAATGADIYRWNCQGCHGPDGKGIAPEINSIIGPVQGTSIALTRARMEARGIDADDDMVKQMTELAEQSLRDRLQHGGTHMPPFKYLHAEEVEALRGYLEKLAGVPPTKRDGLTISISAARVGEQILSGTCHTCHDSTGPGASETSMIQGTIPSLVSLPQTHSLSSVIHQVQYGSCTALKLAGNDAMPAYGYFTEDEVAAAYFTASSSR